MNEWNAASAHGLALKGKESCMETLERWQTSFRGDTGEKEGFSPVLDKEPADEVWMHRKSPYSTMNKHQRCSEPANTTWVCPLFKRTKIVRALGITGTKTVLTSLVTGADGQFCCFQSQGTCREDPGINFVILQTVFTSETHFPSLDSRLTLFFTYLFLLFCQSWPLRAAQA